MTSFASSRLRPRLWSAAVRAPTAPGVLAPRVIAAWRGDPAFGIFFISSLFVVSSRSCRAASPPPSGATSARPAGVEPHHACRAPAARSGRHRPPPARVGDPGLDGPRRLAARRIFLSVRGRESRRARGRTGHGTDSAKTK